MKVYKKIGGKILVATLDNPLNTKTCKVVLLNYRNKGKVIIIKNFSSKFKFQREATAEEQDEYYNELV